MSDPVTAAANLRKAFAIIDGVADIRESLEIAAYGAPDDDNDDGGHLNAIIGKQEGYKGRAAKDFVPTAGQITSYIDGQVEKIAETAYVKADLMMSTIYGIVHLWHGQKWSHSIDPDWSPPLEGVD